MKILLTGATGYIGKRLLPVLVENGHEVVCCVRDLNRFNIPQSLKLKVSAIEVDLSNLTSLSKIPQDIEAGYYLVHSMAKKDYLKTELDCAVNFRESLAKTNIKHLIYLSGIVNEKTLSKHLISRRNVEQELSIGKYNFTSIRSGIIIGAGSASFEIIRDLVEKLPIMVAPKWLLTRSQPIAISDVIKILNKTLDNSKTFNKNFDIGGPEIISYKDILIRYSSLRSLQRRIFIVPVMTPKLSSYWLYFVTSTAYNLAVSLVESMKVEVVCRDKSLENILSLKTISYEKSLQNAFKKIEANEIISSWKDALISDQFNVSDFINVPKFGCVKDARKEKFDNRKDCVNRIWKIGGENGWYYANWLWRFRGFLDKLIGGVGLRRGRTNKTKLISGDALDCWRVLYSNKEEGKLLLFAEMKLPGEAWLEFKILDDELIQTATFRPKGLLGRLYWYSVVPLHAIIFNGMIKKLSNG